MTDEKRPNPGSEAAYAIGCRCPILDNAHGRGDGPFWIRADCPVHAIAEDAQPPQGLNR